MPNWRKVIVSGSDAALNSLNVTSGLTVTGSLNVSGSTTQIGNNTLLGNTLLSGSITISGSSTPGSPTASVQIYGDIRQSGYHRFDPVTTNIDTTTSASYIYVSGSTNDLYFSQNNSGYTNTTRLRWLEGNLYTGLLHGGLITTQSSTIYQIGSGSGIIVDLNASIGDDPYPTIQFLEWPNLSASIAPLTASYQQAFVGIDSTNNIYAQGTPFNNGQFNSIINLGNVLFQNQSTINGVKTQPSVAYGFEQAQNVFNRAFGPLKLSGYTLTPSGSSTGSLIVGSGTAYAPGSNYTLDPNDPSYTIDPGTNVSKIFRYYQSGSSWVYLTNAGAGYATIDPSQYSNNGTLASVGGGNWSIQRVFYFPNSVTKAIVVYYGNAVYPTEAEALANLAFEPFVEAPNTAANAIYLGAIIINQNGVFTSPNTFTIYPGGLFRQVGGSGGGGSTITTTLAGLSDVSITSPTNGQPLVYNSTSVKWENQSTLTANLVGNASTATTASYALTASYTPAIAGTDNYIPRFNGTSALENSVMYDNGTNIGIGTTAPGQKLHVAGTVITTSTLNSVHGSFSIDHPGIQTWKIGVTDGNTSTFHIGNDTGGSFSTKLLNLTNAGNVGIGTTNPVSYSGYTSLTIGDDSGTKIGLLKLRSNYNSGNGAEIYQNGSGIIYINTNSSTTAMTITAAGNVGIGITNPSYKLDVAGTFGTSGDATFNGTYTNINSSYITVGNDATDVVGIAGSTMYFPGTGNVGIGTTNPGSKLYIEGGSANWSVTNPGTTVGTIHLDPGTSSDNYGNAITFGASDSSAGSTAQAGIYVRSDGSYGTKMYFGTTNSYVDGSFMRMIIDETGNVGIGVTNPNTTLEVNRNVSFSSIDTYAQLVVKTTSGANGKLLNIGVDESAGLSFIQSLNRGTDSMPLILQRYSGNVGIGITNPSGKLTVSAAAGNVLLDQINGDEVAFRLSTINHGSNTAPGLTFTYGLFYNTQENAAIKFNRGGSTTGGYLTFTTNDGTERMRIDNSGNVGIGTTNPAYKLSVVGKIALNSGAGNDIFIGDNAGLSDDATNNANLAIGINASQNNVSGSQNVAIGNNSLQFNVAGNNTAVGSNASRYNTLGDNNTSFGSYAMWSTIDGRNNTGIGAAALLFNTSGSSNTAVGSSALRNNTSGSGNIGIGLSALNPNTLGNDNIAVGRNAGRYYGSTGTNALTNTSASIFIGDTSRANNLNETNQIVIGVAALGLGSNTVVLGNDNITTTALKGNVGIGTTNPTQNLHVAGNLRVTGAIYDSNNAAGSSGQVLSSTGTGTDWVSLSEITGVDGTGTANYVTKWQDADTVTNSVMYDDGTNVGIGTTSPKANFHVDGANAKLRVGPWFSSSDRDHIELIANGTDSKIVSPNERFHIENTSGNIILTPAGNIGIGTTNPGYKLDLVAASTSDGIRILQSGASRFIFNGDGVAYWGGSSANAGQLTWDTGKAIVMGQSGAALSLGSNGTWDRMFLDTSGNVGIGTNSPSQKLEVNGGDALIRNAFIGLISGYGSNYASFSHTSRSGAGEYSFLSGNAGETYVNSKSGYPIYFRNNNNDTVIFTSAGNVGIGTTSPDTLLHVYGSGNTFTRYTNTSNSGHYVDVGANSGGEGFIYGYGAYPLIFGTNGSTRMTISSGGNVGIGTTNPDAKLEVIGTIASDYSMADSGNLRILKPRGATYITTNSSVAGAIKITYPVGFTNTMHRIKLNVYEYTTNESFTIYFGGYNYAPDSSWYNPFAYILNNPAIDRNFTVRFGHDGTNLVVYIGELNSGWTYPQVFIEEVELGYSGANDTWRDGAWSIGFESSTFQNVSQTVSNTQSTNLARNGSDAYYNLGNVGIGTASPSRKIHIYGTNPSALLQDPSTGYPYLQLNTSTGNFYFSIDNTAGTGFGTANARFIYSDGNYPMLFVTNDTERMRITGAGNVGIGTTNPYSGTGVRSLNINATDYPVLALSVSGTLVGSLVGYSGYTTLGAKSGNYLVFAPDDTERMRITAAGDVGIGITNPSYKLDVNGTTRSTTFRSDSATSSTGIEISAGTTSGNGAIFRLSKDASNKQVYQTFEYDTLYLGVAASQTSLADIGTKSGVSLAFNTSYTERMRITDGGYVGIGTTNPSNKLTVYQDGGVRVTGITNGSYIEISGDLPGYSANSYPVIKSGGSIHFANNGKYAGYLEGSNTYFGILDSGQTTRVFLNTGGSSYFTGGDVGIGTTNPSTKLHVVGSSIISNTTSINPDSYTNTVIAGGIGTTGGWGLNSAIGGNAGTGHSWAIGSNGSNLFMGYEDGTNANSMQTFLQVDAGTRNVYLVPNSGNVGINATSPSARLDVNGGDGTPAGEQFAAVIKGHNGGSRTLYFDGTSNASVWWGSGNSPQFAIDSTSGGGASFWTNDGSWSERMRIASGGAVGIGTTNPSQKLHVAGNLRVTGAIYDSNNSAGSSGEILTSTGTGTDWVSLSSISGVDGTGTANYVPKWTDADTIGNSAIYDNSGNIGIGTTNPGAKLEVVGTFRATTKSFLIDHPTKEGKKLQYGVLEGPEHSVYVRGKLTGTRRIELPDYWHALVDENSITVNLTAIGRGQQLWVEEITDTYITVGSEAGIINCFYAVFAERKDVDKLITEFDKE